MGLPGMVFSTISIAVGAVLYWAVTAQGHGFRVSTVGVILMIVGAIGLVTSAAIFATARRTGGTGRHSFDRQAIDSQGRSTVVHEEVR